MTSKILIETQMLEEQKWIFSWLPYTWKRQNGEVRIIYDDTALENRYLVTSRKTG